MTPIDIDEVEFLGITTDPCGKVFFWNDGVYRGIFPEKVEDIRAMLQSGLIDELVKKNLFPATAITEFSLDGYGLILQHQAIPAITYPYEWPFEMIKDAALTVLRVNEIARKYGYQTIDAHPFNILFEFDQPKFVDLGSFRKIPGKEIPWPGYEEFVKCCYYTLKIWETGNHFLAQRLVSDRQRKMPHSDYYLYKYAFLRWFSPRTVAKILDSYYKFTHITLYSNEEIKKRLQKQPWLAKLVIFLRNRNLLPFQTVNYKKWIKKISAIKKRNYETHWGEYHTQFSANGSEIIATERFRRIVEIIKNEENEISNAVELAGNQGIFSQLLLQETKIKHVICTDYDSNAIAALYQRLKNKNIKITPAILDFAFPIHTSFTKSPTSRFRSDLVIALAVTHHLVLSQSIDIEEIFILLSQYTEKYVAVEFMPLGLYHQETNPNPSIPKWYNISWFRRNFEDYFTIIAEEQLEKNRVIFFGKK